VPMLEVVLAMEASAAGARAPSTCNWHLEESRLAHISARLEDGAYCYVFRL
jgi:hypothetical protein